MNACPASVQLRWEAARAEGQLDEKTARGDDVQDGCFGTGIDEG